MTDTSLSILLPVHSTRFLRETLLSIYMSSGINDSWELIVVLDRVSREDFASANPIKNKRINYLVLESASPGIVNALNLGLSACNGKYIARIDEDDLVSPERFRKQMKYLEKHPKTLAVGGSLRLINEKGDTIGFKAYPIFHRTIVKKIYDYSPLPHPGAMFLASAAREIGGYNLGVPEDWDLWIRMSRIGKLHNLSDIVISYRQHDSQLSKTKLYKAETARRLVFAAENKSQRELLSLSENPDLVLDLCEHISKEGEKKIHFKRLQRYENFERLRISWSEPKGVIAKCTHMWKISQYPNFITQEVFLKIRSMVIGKVWNINIKQRGNFEQS